MARSGFNAAGSSVTVNDTITIMKRLRQPSPNEGTLTTDQVVLSEYIYSGETISGVTNNSTQAYPKPFATWLTPDLERERTTTFRPRLAVVHHYARSGRPVAAVKFSASDGTNTVEVTVSTMSQSQYLASGFYVSYFEPAIDTSTLNEGLVTVDAIIYPWVGDAFQISVDADTYPSPNLTVLKFLNDRAGGYGEAYAYVSPTGNNATAVVSATPATALASPFLTVPGAAGAIQTFNNANYGRNNASGGTIRLLEGTFTHGSFSSVAVENTGIPLVIEAADPSKKGTTIYADSGSSVSNGCPDKVKWKDITLRKVGASVVMLDSQANSATPHNMMVLQNVSIDQNGTSSYSAWIYRPGRLWLVNVDGGALNTMNTQANVAKWSNIIGCSAPWESDTAYSVWGSKLTRSKLRNQSSNGNMLAGIGQVIGFSHLTQPTNGQGAIETGGQTIGARGIAFAMTVMEQTGGTSAPVFKLHADGDTSPNQNVVRQCLTVVGSRSNEQYQDTGTTTVAKRGMEVFCVHETRNTKSDVFGTPSGNRIGNWPEVFAVGKAFNFTVAGGDDAGVPGTTGAWIGEVVGLGSVNGTSGSPKNPDWLNDLSFPTTIGGGDYTPGASSELPFIPAGRAPYPYDMKGRPVSNSGTARIGAIQPSSAAYTLTADPASYAMTGQSVAVKAGRAIVASAASFAFTAMSVNLSKSKTLVASVLRMNFVGGPLTLNGDPMVLNGDPLTFTPQSVNMVATRKLVSSPGVFALSGQSMVARATRRVAAASASFAATGQTMAARVIRTIYATTLGLTINGQGAGMVSARRASFLPSNYGVTGQSATLRADRRLASDASAYSITGQLMNLIKNGLPGYFMQAAPAAFVMSLGAATIRAARSIFVPSAATYLAAGGTATLRADRRIMTVSATGDIVGQPVALSRGKYLGTAPANFTIGTPAQTLRVARRMVAGAASAAIMPEDAVLAVARVLKAAPAVFATTDQGAGLVTARRIAILPADYRITPEIVRLFATAGLTLISSETHNKTSLEVWRIA